ncbi:MoaD/ThiS family protein [Winogradskyella jejuensis]|uniref:Molybdopterin synthase subunit MoaD n=1 Tax=Winogradskyella jejuensis TaxID=1089305 RepID=A0A1M5KSS9_9FLAO|nr:MoaD/ThiS family protein [Winogradskyella jejuensis]SHG55805.1 molybdopterin synthase subunit MoaD [Winogradskyella jejuensis]
MQIDIKYFGMLAEITGCDSEKVESEIQTVADLQKVLLDKYPDFKNKDFRIAQNQELVALETKLTGQEIAVLPPFAGG